MSFAIPCRIRIALLGAFLLAISGRSFAVDYPSAVWKPAAIRHSRHDHREAVGTSTVGEVEFTTNRERTRHMLRWRE